MPDLPASDPPDALVARLRAAGCVYAEDEARLLVASTDDPHELEDRVRRRVDGFPLEHIVGWVEFRGRRLRVDAGVFVPRWRTDFLAEQSIARARRRSDPVVVELCCGVAAVASAIADDVPGARIYAADIDPAATACARENLGERGHVLEGDLYEPLPPALAGHVDVLVANAPYVPSREIETMPQEARLHEASVALDGGDDGLDVQRRIANEAGRWLSRGGSLLIETSERQAPQTAALMLDGGLVPRIGRSREHDATIVIGDRP